MLKSRPRTDEEPCGAACSAIWLVPVRVSDAAAFDIVMPTTITQRMDASAPATDGRANPERRLEIVEGLVEIRRHVDEMVEFAVHARKYGVDMSLLAVAEESASVEFGQGLSQLRLRVHDDGSPPCNRFTEGLPGNEEEADTFRAGMHGNVVSTVENDQ